VQSVCVQSVCVQSVCVQSVCVQSVCVRKKQRQRETEQAAHVSLFYFMHACTTYLSTLQNMLYLFYTM